MGLTIRPAVLEDLIEIGDYIALDDPARARSFVAEIEALIVDGVAMRPRSFPARDDVMPGLRVAHHGRYLIFFLLSGRDIEVVRVLHGARDVRQVFGR